MWHISRKGKSFGPLLPEKLAALIRAGKVDGTDLVWMEGMEAWIPANTCPPWAKLFASTQDMAPMESVAEPVQAQVWQEPSVRAVYKDPDPDPIVNPLKRSIYVIRCAWALSLVMFVIFWAIMPPGDGDFINQHALSIKLQGEIGWGILLMLCTADILVFHVIETLIHLNANIAIAGKTDEG